MQCIVLSDQTYLTKVKLDIPLQAAFKPRYLTALLPKLSLHLYIQCLVVQDINNRATDKHGKRRQGHDKAL